MEIGDMIRTPRGSFKVMFDTLSSAEAAGFAMWFCVYDDDHNVVGYAVTGRCKTSGWAKVGIALA